MTSGGVPDPLNPCPKRAYPLVKFSFRTWYWINALYSSLSFVDVTPLPAVLLLDLDHDPDSISPFNGVLDIPTE